MLKLLFDIFVGVMTVIVAVTFVLAGVYICLIAFSITLDAFDDVKRTIHLKWRKEK